MTEQTKRCTKCGTLKSLDEFHKDAASNDGRKTACKPCRCAATLEYEKTPKGKVNKRKSNARYSKTDKGRVCQKHKSRRYTQTEKGRYCKNQIIKRQALLHPEKISARSAVKSALRAGKLHRQPCEACGDTPSEAHHEDYGKPLDVTWLCRKHHLERHNKRPVEEKS